MDKDRERCREDKFLFAILLLVYSALTLYLFTMQCYQVPEFEADMPAYVRTVQGVETDYKYPYPLFFILAKGISWFCGAPLAVAIVTTALNSFAICIARNYMGRMRDSFFAERKGKGVDIMLTFLTFALFLLGNLYSPKYTAFFGFEYAYRCMGIYTPNPLWNATYLATRPFAVICFFESCRMLILAEKLWKEKADSGWRDGFKNFPWKETIPFAVSLFLTTFTKPSFTMVVVPGMGILLLIQLMKSRGKSFLYAFALCLTMIPTGIDLLYQFFGLFTGVNTRGEETGIGFAFAKVWSIYSQNIPLSIVMGMALPIGVLLLNKKEFLRNAYYRFSWYLYLVSAIMFLCLYEKGFRMPHANFSWGYMHGMFFVFMMTLIVMLKNTLQWRKGYKVIFVLAEWAVFCYHLICGTYFMIYMLQGKAPSGF
ncbi:MAG: hypothetical protein NC417_00920 [Candidatus Gastranaerophilales bacterium]|nr:hypothetical protein [Candidatus Gastranaerophilales bacterium]